MIKLLRNVPRHFKEAYHGLSRNAVMTLSSSTAVTVTLLLIGIFFILAMNLESFTKSVENDVRIHVKICNETVDEVADQVCIAVADEDIPALQKKVEAISGVRHVVYSSKDNELDELIKAYGTDGGLFGEYRGEGNPLKRAFIVDVQSGDLIDSVTENIMQIKGIYSARYGGTNVLKMMEAFGSIRSGGLIFVVILTSLAIFLISNTIKIAIFSRQKEISIMRLVGASNGFIRTPYLIEGIVIGLLGAIIPIGVCAFGYPYLYESLNGVFFTEMFPLISPFPFLYQIILILIGASVAVGLIGSYISVSRFLWWKR